MCFYIPFSLISIIIPPNIHCRSHTSTFIATVNYNNYYITCSEDHYYTVIITTKLRITIFYHFPSEDEVVIIVNSLLSIHYLCSEQHLLVVKVTREITTTQ